GTRLVVDIGGGSTELIIGERFEPQMMESLHMGCVTMSAGYFAEGVISESAWRRADIAARLELQPIALVYRLKGWQTSVGASGTIIAIERAVQQMGWSRFGISLESLHQLRQYMLRAGHVDRLQIEAVSRDRAPVFAGGVAVLLAVFEALGIAHMRVSDGALREGLVYDLLGRITHEDVRGRTIESLMRRFQVDVVHAQRVERTVTALFDALADAWKLDEDYAYALMWAVRLHEVGLAISHSQYHKHGAYLIENADLSGFSRQGQKMLALLVRTHRRKFPTRLFDELADEHRNKVLQLAMLLRVAVLLHRSRGEEPIPIREVAAIQGGLRIVFEGGWLDAHPLTRADLERERDYLKTAKMRLKFE
ncbi:MAG: Ppx/GppA phosphatase family protein, partial [Ectothiorhodospiraceae bacterium]|nr:Ppx/GppA phosphatase family protein [Ectothiorhodospiraceae bacterium]